MEVRDSRRLTGPNLIASRAGAVLDVAFAPESAERALDGWRAAGRRILGAVGWPNEELLVRRFPGGASLVMTAPIDALYAATEVNEWAWQMAAAKVRGDEEPELDGAAERLRQLIDGERNPALLALEEAARARGVCFLSDDDLASVGQGTGARVWPVRELPSPDAIDWQAVHDIPLALVTGTNGKTTTVRLLARMVEAAGRVAGFSTTDGLRVGAEVLGDGDYSGPGGARQVLRHPRVEVAILETARGGMLRRGLAVRAADVAVVTNVAEDHLGEFGVSDLEAVADAKLVVTSVARCAVLNADDGVLRARAGRLPCPALWFALDSQVPGDGCVLENGIIVLDRRGERTEVLPVDEVPITLAGRARHNVANALAAVAAAAELGLPIPAIRSGLRALAGTAADNPGRLNTYNLGGAQVIVDFAHNQHGLDALLETAGALVTGRLLVLLGQAGDRDDPSIRSLARAVWKRRPDRVVLKEMHKYLRGRDEGEVTRLLRAELEAQGAPPEVIVEAESELAGARQALAWARPGDLLLLLSHAERSAVLDLVATLGKRGWQPGDPL